MNLTASERLKFAFLNLTSKTLCYLPTMVLFGLGFTFLAIAFCAEEQKLIEAYGMAAGPCFFFSFLFIAVGEHFEYNDLFTESPSVHWAYEVAKTIVSSLSKEQKKVIMDSKLYREKGISDFFSSSGNVINFSPNEIIFSLVFRGYLMANATIGFKLCSKRLYQGELCKKYSAYYAQKVKIELIKDIARKAKLLAQKEFLQKLDDESRANSKLCGARLRFA